MKKIRLFLFISLCLILSSCSSQTSSSKELPPSITIKQAIDLAYSDAIKWDEKAKLIEGTSVDNDMIKNQPELMENGDIGT
ncbi:hypothetical protein MKY30_23730 [Oceanobacillus sp. FSL W8-0428]|uniref:SCP domain-containing protein n=1 Tax=Oceanobacillus sojae TaxID=582851 RepID=A0A511ZIQ5_9BACI|nr:hypothetical protein [Oceanobacillus sojae]GEN87317.1 hypothetical protein OSO01_20560 [Oceanobacillus sojae]